MICTYYYQHTKINAVPPPHKKKRKDVKLVTNKHIKCTEVISAM